MPVIEELEYVEERERSTATEVDAARPVAVAALVLRTSAQVAVTAGALFLFTVSFLVQGFCVYGRCMEPTLRTGERVLGNKLVYRLSKPNRGDTVVFRSPVDSGKIYIKRVIGLPGETIEIHHGRVYINSSPLDEPYLAHRPHGSYGPERIKPDHLFVMGDHRDQSSDSRYWGELPEGNVQAKAWLRYWPINRINLLR